MSDIDQDAPIEQEAGDAQFAQGTGEGEFVVCQPRTPNRSALVLLGLLLTGGCLTYFMYLHSGPRAAAANAEAEAARETITQFLDSGGENIRTMQAMLRNTEKVVQQFLSYPEMTQVPLEGLRTNPFRFGAAGNGEALSDEATQKQHEQEHQAVLKAVHGLRLQTIMYGPSRRACLIDGTLYQEGQQVAGFTIETIEPQAVLVRNGAYRFELKIR